jgi:hypothetical protein
VLDVVKIPITDVNQKPFSDGTVVLYLNKQKIDKKNIIEDIPNIVVTIRRQSDFLSNFIPQSMNYIEDSVLPEQATMHELKIAFKRLKRVRILYTRMLRSVYQTFFWIYPDFSKICLIIYCILIVFMPASWFLPLFFLIILCCCILQKPSNKAMLKKVTKFFFAKNKHITPYPRVITIREATHQKKSQIGILKEKAQEGVMKRWKKFKEDAVELQNYLMLIACYGEKLRQLFLWEDPEKSYYFCIGLLITIVLFFLVPTRLIILFIGLHRFYKGYKFTHRRIKYNQRLCEEVLTSLFKQYSSDSFFRTDSTHPWAQEITDKSGLQKKIVEGIRTRLSLEVDSDLFKKCTCPKEMLEYISSCQVMLKHKDNKGEHVYDFGYSKHDNLLWGFLTNVPSEYYRMEHPRVADVESYY